jgi:lipopolysaccharide export system protein LptC
MKSVLYIAAFAFSCILCGIVVGQEGQAIGLKGLKVPMEFYPDGTLKALLKAETSTVDAAGEQIRGENLRYETYTSAGTTDIVIAAESCLYNKSKGYAESDGRVRLEKGDVVITGKGFTLDSTKEIISLHSEVVVEFERGLMTREKKK